LLIYKSAQLENNSVYPKDGGTMCLASCLMFLEFPKAASLTWSQRTWPRPPGCSCAPFGVPAAY